MRAAPSPPDHLTDFGFWLWSRWPFPTKEKVASGEAFHGLRSARGVLWGGVLTDYYHGYWPSLGLRYWRRSVWVCGVKIIGWQRKSK